MKKFIALALVLASGVALCAFADAAPTAAGTSEAVPVQAEPAGASGSAPLSRAELKQQAEQLVFDAGVTLLEEGKYDEALEAFGKIESYRKVADKVQETLTKKEEAESLAAERKAYEDAVALLEEGKYDEALEAFSKIESYRKVDDMVREALTKKEEAEKLAAEAAEAARPRITVEINKKNWKDYFELVQIPVRNNLDELDNIAYVFRPKAEIKDRIDYDSEFSIDIKHTDTYTGEYNFKFNPATNRIRIGKARFTAETRFPNIFHISNEGFKSFVFTDYESCCYNGDPLMPIFRAFIYYNEEIKLLQVYEVKISKVQGTLVLFDEGS